MSRYNSGSHRDPLLIQLDRHSNLSALHEAKLAAWAFAIGEDGPFSEMPGRRAHRGMLPDLPMPEPPPSGRRRPPFLVRLGEVVRRAFDFGRAPVRAATAMGPTQHAAVGESAGMAYIDLRDAESAVKADNVLPIRSRAA